MSIVLQNDIKAIVRANTTEEEAQITVVENLERYIKNPATVDIGFKFSLQVDQHIVLIYYFFGF